MKHYNPELENKTLVDVAVNTLNEDAGFFAFKGDPASGAVEPIESNHLFLVGDSVGYEKTQVYGSAGPDYTDVVSIATETRVFGTFTDTGSITPKFLPTGAGNSQGIITEPNFTVAPYLNPWGFVVQQVTLTNIDYSANGGLMVTSAGALREGIFAEFDPSFYGGNWFAPIIGVFTTGDNDRGFLNSFLTSPPFHASVYDPRNGDDYPDLSALTSSELALNLINTFTAPGGAQRVSDGGIYVAEAAMGNSCEVDIFAPNISVKVGIGTSTLGTSTIEFATASSTDTDCPLTSTDQIAAKGITTGTLNADSVNFVELGLTRQPPGLSADPVSSFNVSEVLPVDRYSPPLFIATSATVLSTLGTDGINASGLNLSIAQVERYFFAGETIYGTSTGATTRHDWQATVDSAVINLVSSVANLNTYSIVLTISNVVETTHLTAVPGRTVNPANDPSYAIEVGSSNIVVSIPEVAVTVDGSLDVSGTLTINGNSVTSVGNVVDDTFIPVSNGTDYVNSAASVNTNGALNINSGLYVEAGTTTGNDQIVFQLKDGVGGVFRVNDLNGASMLQVNDAPSASIGSLSGGYNMTTTIHGDLTIGDGTNSRNLVVTGDISGGTGTTIIGKANTATRIFGTTTARGGATEAITAGAGTSYNFLAVAADNEMLTSPNFCATGDGALEIPNTGLTISTTTNAAGHNDQKRFAVNLSTEDALVVINEHTGGSTFNSILQVNRTDTDGNRVTLGTSGVETDLIVNGDLTLAKETTAGFLINNTSGVVDSTTNGSTLTNVNAATVDNTNSTSNLSFWSGTLLEYQGLTPDDNTLYNVIDDASPGTLNFGGPVTMSSTLTVGGNTTINGDLTVTGTFDAFPTGTWTPTLNVAGTLVSSVGTWTRFGDRVAVDFNIQTNSTETGADAVEVNNLPFTNLTQNTGTSYYSSSLGTDTPLTIATGATTTLAVLIKPDGGFLERSELFDGGVNRLYGNITYRIS